MSNLKDYIHEHVLQFIYWYLHRLDLTARETFVVGLLDSVEQEQLALKLLRAAGSKTCVLSSRILPYLDEITRLCLYEQQFVYSTDDVLGSGYFRARRVMTKMKVAHPSLRVRDLWKAVDYCSSLSSVCSTLPPTGPKPTLEHHLQVH